MGQDGGSEPGAPFAFRLDSHRTRLGALGPRKHAVQERSRETVEVVLEAAAQVFEQVGFAAATTERIAERAGVSVGTLYQYWPNKQAIAVALMERHGEDGLSRLLPALRGLDDTALPPAEKLEALVRALVALHDDRPDLHWVLESEAQLPRPYRERVHELTRALAGVLESKLGLPAERALVVACSLEALPHALIRPATRLDADRTVRELTDLLVAYALRG